MKCAKNYHANVFFAEIALNGKVLVAAVLSEKDAQEQDLQKEKKQGKMLWRGKGKGKGKEILVKEKPESDLNCYKKLDKNLLGVLWPCEDLL